VDHDREACTAKPSANDYYTAQLLFPAHWFLGAIVIGR
jgi:hypothetical protein